MIPDIYVLSANLILAVEHFLLCNLIICFCIPRFVISKTYKRS